MFMTDWSALMIPQNATLDSKHTLLDMYLYGCNAVMFGAAALRCLFGAACKALMPACLKALPCM
jgi:hypothetical protein